MKAVKQRTQSDCVLAAVANATGVPYALVRKVYGKPGRGLDYADQTWLMEQFGVWKETTPRRPLTLASWLARHRTGRYILVAVDSYFAEQSHAFACVDGTLLGKYKPEKRIIEYHRLIERRQPEVKHVRTGDAGTDQSGSGREGSVGG